ncbi:nucleotidyltransferase domain protein [archaeon BMS3Bbin15]|nr:nucleotidyltransferase domain protein [archaeon BMS3Bbin15]
MIDMKNIPPSLRKRGLKKKLAKLCEENEIVYMGIFGSFIRGNQKIDSDIDILIKYKENSRKSLLDMVRLEEELSNLFGRKVDLLTIESISPYIRDEILKSRRVIYEAE